MIMCVVDIKGFNICKLNIDSEKFYLGQIIEHESLIGKYKVINLDPETDPETVTIRKIK